jgi:CubicO group peptidase (beta-lactamase class C family)
LVPALAGGSDLSSLKARVDGLLAPQMESAVAAGAIVGVIDGEQSVTWGRGTTHLNRQSTPNADTVFEIGSITKVFTAIVLASAVERGEVSLDDTLGSLLPELRGTAVETLTLRQLTTHASGLPRVPADLRRPPFDAQNPFRFYDLPRAVAYLQPPFKPSEPPKTFDLNRYSNLGVGLLGRALARRLGRELDSLISERVTRPLGMTDTAYTLDANQTARFAQPYDETFSETPMWEVADLSRGAGGLKSTARDLLRLLRASLRPPKSEIGRALQRSQEVLLRGPTQSIAMNWIHGGRGSAGEVWHNGGTGGVRGLIAFDRAQSRALVMFGTSSNFLSCLEEEVFGAACTPKVEPPMTEEEAAPVVGAYRDAKGNSIEIVRRGPILLARLSLDGERQNVRLYRDGKGYRLLGNAHFSFENKELLFHAQGKVARFGR